MKRFALYVFKTKKSNQTRLNIKKNVLNFDNIAALFF